MKNSVALQRYLTTHQQAELWSASDEISRSAALNLSATSSLQKQLEGVYPEDHPLSKMLNERFLKIMARFERCDLDPKVFVFSSPDPEAMVSSQGHLFISTAMLALTKTYCALDALLFHEAKHVVFEDAAHEMMNSNGLALLGRRRISEASADLFATIELDEQGGNAYGQRLLIRALEEHYNLRAVRVGDKKIKLIDPEHGSLSSRELDQIDLGQIWDLRNYATQTEDSFNFREYLKAPLLDSLGQITPPREAAEFVEFLKRLAALRKCIGADKSSCDELLSQGVTVLLQQIDNESDFTMDSQSDDHMRVAIEHSFRELLQWPQVQDSPALTLPELLQVSRKLSESVGRNLSWLTCKKLIEAQLATLCTQATSPQKIESGIKQLRAAARSIFTSASAQGREQEFNRWFNSEAVAAWFVAKSSIVPIRIKDASQFIAGSFQFEVADAGSDWFCSPTDLVEMYTLLGSSELSLEPLVQAYFKRANAAALDEVALYVDQDSDKILTNRGDYFSTSVLPLLKKFIAYNLDRDPLERLLLLGSILPTEEAREAVKVSIFDFYATEKRSSFTAVLSLKAALERQVGWLLSPLINTVVSSQRYDLTNSVKELLSLDNRRKLSFECQCRLRATMSNLSQAILEQRRFEVTLNATSSEAAPARTTIFSRLEKNQEAYNAAILGLIGADSVQEAVSVLGEFFDGPLQNSIAKIEDPAKRMDKLLKLRAKVVSTSKLLYKSGVAAVQITSDHFLQIPNFASLLKVAALEVINSRPQDLIPALDQACQETRLAFVSVKSPHFIKLRHDLLLNASPIISAENFPSTKQDYEFTLQLALLGQDSHLPFPLARSAFAKRIELCESLDEGRQLLRKYSYLPLGILLAGVNQVADNLAHQTHELDLLVGDAIKIVMHGSLNHEQVAVATLAEGFGINAFTADERLEFLDAATQTFRSDLKIREFTLPRWFRMNALENVLKTGDRTAFDDLNQLIVAIRQEFYELERQPNMARPRKPSPNPDYVALRYVTRDLPESVQGATSYQDTLNGLFRMDGVTLQRLMRAVLMEGDEALYKSEHTRHAVLKRVINNYVKLDRPNDRKIVEMVSGALEKVVSPEKLYEHTGRLLTAVSFQEPRSKAKLMPTLQRFVSEDARIMALKTRVLGNPAVKTKQSFVEFNRQVRLNQYDPESGTPELTKAAAELKVIDLALALRVRAFVEVKPPQVEIRQVDNQPFLSFESPDSTPEAALASIPKIAAWLMKGRRFGEQFTVAELGVVLAEYSGALGVKLLQLMALYLPLSPEDRATLSGVFDKLEGQGKLSAFRILKREAALCEDVGGLFARLEQFGSMIGGASIVTQFKATVAGQEMALGITNPNAIERTKSLKQLLTSVLDYLIEQEPENASFKLVRALIEDAAKWVIGEIEHDSYGSENEEFWRMNDSRSNEQNGFIKDKTSSWSIRVPHAAGVNNRWVRAEEFVDSVDLAELSLTSAATDLSAGKLNSADARDVVTTITENYLYQVLTSGVAHSDIHPGNLALTSSGEIAIFDRKYLLYFDQSEREQLQKVLLNSGKHDIDGFFVAIAEIAAPQHADKLVDLLRQSATSLPGEQVPDTRNQIAAVLSAMRSAGIELELKWVLLLKNMLALDYLSVWAGYAGIGGALTRAGTRNTAQLLDTARRIVPKFKLTPGVIADFIRA